MIRMNGGGVWARCQSCGTELKKGDKVCPKCGSTKKASDREASVAIGVRIVETRVRQIRKGFKKFMKEIISRWRPSISPELKDGVNEERIIDKERNEYQQTVKDARTGEIAHEEHEPLSQHRHGFKR